jgi:hypothetical protein
MNAVDWRRVVLCGLVAGTVWALLSMILVGALGGDFFATISGKVPGGAPTPAPHLSLYFLSVAAGVWGVWLYAVIRPRSSSNLKAGVMAGFAWWTIASLQSLKWVVLLQIPVAAWLPLAASLILCVVATLCGALLYGNAPSNPPLDPVPGSSTPAISRS